MNAESSLKRRINCYGKITTLLFLWLLLLAISIPVKAQSSLSYTFASNTGTSGVYSSPSLAVLNGKIYSAYTNSSGIICMTGADSTTVTPNWTPICGGVGVTLPAADSQPALVAWNGQLLLAYARASDHVLILATSVLGQGDYTVYAPNNGTIYVAAQPALTIFNNEIYVAYQENASDHYLGLAHAAGVGDTFANTLYSAYRIGHSPGMTTFGDELVIAYFCQCDSHYLDILTTTDGSTFSFHQHTGAALSNLSPPSLVAYNGVLSIVYINNGTNDIYTTTTYDPNATSFTAPQRQSGMNFSLGGPTVVYWNGVIYAAWEGERALSSGNGGAHYLYVSTATPPS